MLISPRSGRVSSERYHYHLAPSGKLAPALPYPRHADRSFSVRPTIFREFLEECCGYPELSRDTQSLGLDLEATPEIRRLNDMLKQETAKLIYSGVAVNMLNLQPEVCTVLVVLDPTWMDSLRLNWEFANDHLDHLPQGIKVSGTVPLDDDLRFMGLSTTLTLDNLVPVGAASIVMGLEIARQLLGGGWSSSIGAGVR